MKCESCNIEIKGLSDHCPLCGKFLIGNKSDDQPYPVVNKKVNPKVFNKTIKMLMFFTIVISIILLTINILTFVGYVWCVIPIAAMLISWFIFLIPYLNKGLKPLMIFLDNVIICVFIIIIDLTTKQHGWAMSYVVPFILFGSASVITFIVMFWKMTWKEFYLFQMTIAGTCFIPLIMRIFFKFLFWPSIVSAVYGVITIIGMLIFGDKKLKYEITKRVHF